MDEELYRVSRDEYAGVLMQTNPKYIDIEECNKATEDIIKVKTKDGIHLTTCIVPKNQDEVTRYYVYNLPRGDAYLPPQPVRKIVIETQEEFKKFLEALGKREK